MPQTSKRLRRKFMTETDDGIDKAEKVCAAAGCKVMGGIINVPDYSKLSEDARDAVQYLCEEWDYAVCDERIK